MNMAKSQQLTANNQQPKAINQNRVSVKITLKKGVNTRGGVVLWR